MDTPSPLSRGDRSRAALGPRQPEAAPMVLYQEDHAPALEQLRELAGEATVRDDRDDEDDTQC